MERTDKDTSPLLFELVFTQLKNCSHYFTLNCLFIALQFALLLAKLYTLIDPNMIKDMALPFPTIFIALSVLLGLFLGLTLFSSHFQLMASVWVYGLLLLQALEMVFIEVSVQCFTGSDWCAGQVKYQLSVFVMLAAFMAVVFLRAQCYCPFQDGSNPLSMNSGQSVLFLLAYSALISLSTNPLFISNITAAQQLTFFLTCGLYAVISTPPQASPALARIFSVCSLGLLWTSGLIWLAPVLQNLLNLDSGGSSFWYQWGYSFPIVMGLGVVQSSSLKRGYRWKELFAQGKEEDLKILYLQIAQLVKVMEAVRKSQLRANSSEFKMIWQLIGRHNRDCSDAECALKSLQGMRVQRGDQLMEQKRFSKTVEKVLQFALHRLVRQKDVFPNSIPLNLQIAHFELEVFHQRTKGLQLYNRQYGRPGLGREQAWGIFYLRKKIQGFDSSGQARAKGESEEQIAAFKHDIEVSVSLLAQFWYFLSDPKCNLKKLYDLANVLFPMKIRVDQTWRTIRTLRSIQCYNLYARYLIKMFNDKEKGLKILQEARKLQAENNQKEEITAGTEGNLNQQHGVIFLQFDGKNSGIMYQVNTACELIFGYGKGELQGRKVNDIMPRIIAFHHDKILQHYQQTNRPRMMNKERTIWGRSKDGYLFPFTICIKPVRNYYSQTSEVYASVKRGLWVRESAFFFTDSDLNLSDASASLLSFFPSLHGRLHLKKKVNIEEIVPDFAKHRDRVVTGKETYDFTLQRSFSIGEGRQYTDKVPLSLVGEEVSVNVSGFIGYYFRLIKTSGSSYGSYDQSNVSLRQGNADASNSYWMKRENDFRFVASVGDSTAQRAMVYHGGLVKSNNQTRQLIYSRIQSSFLMTKQANQQQDAFEQREYGGDIKTRRLQGGVFRQIHELSEQSEQNNMASSGQHEEEQGLEMVKPSQLNAILSRQNGSRHINMLKAATVAILLLSTLLAIFQYALTFSHAQELTRQLSGLASLNSLEAQVMYVNLYSNFYSLGLSSASDTVTLKAEINELNSLAGVVPFSVSTSVTYSDGSNQTMILAFAINKLISQAQLLAAAGSVSPNDPDLFFVQYNSVNGLEAGCSQSLIQARSSLLSLNDSVLTTYSIYLGLSAAAYFVILVFKNLVLRAVLRKKAQILNVFFEIPRFACTAIQKQCERFIQRLTMDEEEEEVFEVEAQVEDEQSSNKRYSKQKKRTIMGEEKTAINFVLVSLLLLAFLLLYPTLVIISAKTAYKEQQYSFTAIAEIVRFEKEMAKLNSFIDTHYAKPSFTLANSNASQVIASQYQNITKLFTGIQEYLYYLADIFSSSYLQKYNQLFFNPLCNDATPNCSLYGQSKGLNNMLFYYFDYAVGKFQLYSGPTPDLNSARSASTIQKQLSLRVLLKQYWRRLNSILVDGLDQLVRRNDSALFGVMLTVCIVNMTVLLWAWIRFYNSLGQKIMATEYILTFIPIDQINKNPKIAKYIKEQVLRAQ